MEFIVVVLVAIVGFAAFESVEEVHACLGFGVEFIVVVLDIIEGSRRVCCIVLVFVMPLLSLIGKGKILLFLLAVDLWGIELGLLLVFRRVGINRVCRILIGVKVSGVVVFWLGNRRGGKLRALDCVRVIPAQPLVKFHVGA